ncbi:MAG: Holliday junction resolvase RuvX [Alphaproteobacteria bacterium]|nr:Holliday junction resolvase RuvX [Alphaproteobacteria bacterium]
MARLMVLDIGKKRSGIAVSNQEQSIALPLTTIPSDSLIAFVKSYHEQEIIEKIYIGYPLNLNLDKTDATKFVEEMFKNIKRKFPEIAIQKIDERFSSKNASRAILDMGLNKTARRNKSLIDTTAATLMLQEILFFKS